MAEEDRAILERKMRKALQVLILQRGRNPGVKGWELKRYLGKDYKKILEVLSDEVKSMGLELFPVPGLDDSEDSVRYLLRFRDPPTMAETETAGFRIDDLAVLAASIAYINAKQGRVPRKDIERFLKEKFPRWRVEYSLDRYVKKGYIDQDGESLLRIGWRTRAEVDEKTLMTLILARGGEAGERPGKKR
jgi:hypothetical protein